MVLPRTAAGVLLTLGLVATFRAQNAAEPLPPELTALAEGFTSERPVPPTLDEAMRTWIEPAEPLKIVGPIYYVGTKGLAAYLITTPKGHILLDGGMPGSAKDFEASIRKAGFKPEDIKLLLITHAHIDHAGVVAHFQKRSNAQVVVMDREFELLNSGGKTSRATRSTSAIAWPELIPGAPCPRILTAGRLLKRSSVSGPDEYSTDAIADTGTICPDPERTHRRAMSSGRLRNAGSADISTCQVRPYLLKSFT